MPDVVKTFPYLGLLNFELTFNVFVIIQNGDALLPEYR